MRQRSRQFASALLVIGVLFGGATSLFAQTVELTPFYGYRFGGGLVRDGYYPYDPDPYLDFDLAASSCYGVVVDVAVSSRFKIEGLVSQQRTKLEAPGFFGPQGPPMVVDKYLFGTQWEFGQDRFRPFLTGLVGFTRYEPDVEGAGSETRFGISFGGGLKVFFNEHYGARFDGRASTGFGNSGAGVSCGFGGCGLSFGGWGSWDGEAAVGFIFAF